MIRVRVCLDSAWSRLFMTFCLFNFRFFDTRSIIAVTGNYRRTDDETSVCHAVNALSLTVNSWCRSSDRYGELNVLVGRRRILRICTWLCTHGGPDVHGVTDHDSVAVHCSEADMIARCTSSWTHACESTLLLQHAIDISQSYSSPRLMSAGSQLTFASVLGF